MRLTIGYFTSRKDPKLEWFLRSLKREVKPSDEIELIVVDFYANDPNRREWFRLLMQTEEIPSNVTFKHTVPKPTIWQGEHKKTKNEYFAASNARNTAFALCSNDFIACVDDLSVLAPCWIDQVRHAHEHGYVILGSYKKVLNLDVARDGSITFTDHPPGVDSRWERGVDSGNVHARGTDLFGCSFGLPIEWALKVNGFDEICDSVSMEDCEFGARLERAGAQFAYNRNMLTYESEELHHTPGNICFIRNDRKTTSGLNADWWILENRVRSAETWTCGNKFNLRDLRQKCLAGEAFPIPTKEIDWATEQPLSEM